MPAYVLLARLSSAGQREVGAAPEALRRSREILARWEANILADHYLLGEWDRCIVFEISDNLRAQKAVLQEELTDSQESLLLPAIDLPLFVDLVKREIRTEGPHEWQVKWWARAARLAMRWYQYDRWIWKYFKPLNITGKENFGKIKGPCIVVANHTSHFDTLALQGALPMRIRSNLYMGAAADRWFLKGGGGRKELELQPWFNSLVGGLFPIRRGGGAAQLDYSKWLLDRGANLGIFPEGTRSTSRHMARFKHGVAILALDRKVPVLPIYLSGLSKIRPKGSRDITPGQVWAHVQAPLYLDPSMSVPDATREIYRSLNEPHQRAMALGPEAGRWGFDDINGKTTATPAQ